jgi:hypothetical protein
MRKVLNISEEKEIINLSEINDKSHIGIQWNGSASRSVVLRKGDKEFVGMQFYDLDLTYSWSRASKKEYVTEAFKQSGAKVFEFDDYKELITWALNNN